MIGLWAGCVGSIFLTRSDEEEFWMEGEVMWFGDTGFVIHEILILSVVVFVGGGLRI